jgi:hypothetical protein
MLKFVHDDMKLVEIWLTKAESEDETVNRELAPLYAEYKKKKYRVAVFCSGKGDMLELTKDLLKHTLEVNAKKELEAEKCR